MNNIQEDWQTGRQSCKLQSQKGPCDVQLCALRSFSPCARPLHGTVGFLKFSNCLTSRGKTARNPFPFSGSYYPSPLHAFLAVLCVVRKAAQICSRCLEVHLLENSLTNRTNFVWEATLFLLRPSRCAEQVRIAIHCRDL